MTKSSSTFHTPLIRGALVALIVSATVLAVPGRSAALTPSNALNDLNAMRSQAGLPLVRAFHGKLNRGCRLHNRYMSRTGQFGHLERRASRHYTSLGARAATRSVFARPGRLPSEAWGDTVYHRLSILQPRLRVSGFSAHAGFSCLQVLSGISRSPVARASGLALYPWPAGGSSGHAPRFPGYEAPNPLLDAPGAAELGTPLTVAVNGPWKHWQLTRSSVSSATLVSDTGEPVAVSVSDRGSRNARYLQGGFALLPRRALAAHAGYTATVSGRVTNRGRSWPFTLSTRFRTGANSDS